MERKRNKRHDRPPADMIEQAKKRLGKEQEELGFAVEAMKTARFAKHPNVRYRVQRLVYRGA